MQLCLVRVSFLPFLKRSWYYTIVVLLYTYVKRIPGYLYDMIHCFVFTYAHILRSIVYTAAVERDTWYIPARCDFVWVPRTWSFSIFFCFHV